MTADSPQSPRVTGWLKPAMRGSQVRAQAAAAARCLRYGGSSALAGMAADGGILLKDLQNDGMGPTSGGRRRAPEPPEAGWP
jgi:hypothetical protein